MRAAILVALLLSGCARASGSAGYRVERTYVPVGGAECFVVLDGQDEPRGLSCFR